ncbi:uncharacterized protein KY384_004694 [Bacidia gigantensis]|uniref:uncharacterized protein n=1 Tax=Bacidia gigantensis TaxID=2732470 RepID=UPI001D0550A6|nr:uncharacterized protein KY384_004694 [Bacidia gigantensis]KAG8530194.1 hypothetical protein KY384_004694 [Bacidia gigantensis]
MTGSPLTAVRTTFEWSKTERLDETDFHISTIFCLSEFIPRLWDLNIPGGYCTRQGFNKVLINFEGKETMIGRGIKRDYLTQGILDGYYEAIKNNRYKGLKVKIYDRQLVGTVTFSTRRGPLEDSNTTSNMTAGISSNIQTSKRSEVISPTLTAPMQRSLNSTDLSAPEFSIDMTPTSETGLSLRALSATIATFYDSVSKRREPLDALRLSTFKLSPFQRPRQGFTVTIHGGNTPEVPKRTEEPYFTTLSVVKGMFEIMERWVTGEQGSEFMNDGKFWKSIVQESGVPLGELWMVDGFYIGEDGNNSQQKDSASLNYTRGR